MQPTSASVWYTYLHSAVLTVACKTLMTTEYWFDDEFIPCLKAVPASKENVFSDVHVVPFRKGEFIARAISSCKLSISLIMV